MLGRSVMRKVKTPQPAEPPHQMAPRRAAREEGTTALRGSFDFRGNREKYREFDRAEVRNSIRDCLVDMVLLIGVTGAVVLIFS
jgi:hypothetical protein